MARRVTIEEAIDLFLEDKRDQDLAEGSIKAYEQSLRQVAEHLKKLRVTALHAVDQSHIKIVFSRSGLRAPDPKTGKPISNGYMNNHIQRTKTFFNWCRDDADLKTNNPTRSLKRIKEEAAEDQRERQFFSDEDLLRVIDAAPHPRDRALCAIAGYGGRRIGEILSCKVGDLNRQDWSLRFKLHKNRTTGTVICDTDLRRELAEWLRFYEDAIGQPLEPDMYLIPRVERGWLRAGQAQPMLERAILPHLPYTSGGAQTMLRVVLEELGLYQPYQKFHVFRRTAGRQLYDELRKDATAGDALKHVQEFYIHKNRAMTEHYLGKSPEREKLAEFMRARKSRVQAEPVDNVIEFPRREAEAG